MTIRELFSCIDTDSCTRMEIVSLGYKTFYLDVEWDNDQDPDLNVFDRIADFRIEGWYVTIDGVIVIRSYDSPRPEIIEFIEEVL